MSKTFFTSDSHFGHEGIIRMCDRPYNSIVEHDHRLIDAWNSVVGGDDTVWHLGDFGYRTSSAYLRAIFDNLRGHKHLIWGNHDHKKSLHIKELPWASQQHMEVINVDGAVITLCHYAMRTWWKKGRGALMLYGHSHGAMPGNRQSCDVGVDVFGPAPVELHTIRAYLSTLPEITYDEPDPEDAETDPPTP